MESSVEQHLTPSRLGSVRDLWFEHLSGPDSLVLPSQDDNKRWFMGGELDRLCVERFAPTLEAIRHSGLKSGTDLIKTAKPGEASDWLSLVILLDQMPRNCYRGDAAAVAFAVFDPMAREVALAAMERGIPDENPQMRWQFAYRHWFYLPLMHSEDLAMHEKATQAYERMRRDAYALADADADEAKKHHPSQQGGDGQEHYRAKAAAVVRASPEEARKLVDLYLEFERRHMAIIERFGRYPHRNKALGRVPTAEETEYLETGGEMFGQ
ncbi:class I alpha-mannosidase [Hirsutella rhossiliensis]|uniref:Class I alpha-mannosidase n=1 Tax=Hirsutella rhossiliensis TaxID=111463 RepID=A0A9P8N330_9HYPO|nr:class I alpha-mannosidase [Hirsutella rhossiliensis]KAH0966017.1 class I alpha-mannosidase [Hirsutella rhossiliensis]